MLKLNLFALSLPGYPVNQHFSLIFVLVLALVPQPLLANSDASLWRNLLLVDQAPTNDEAVASFYLTEVPVDPKAEMQALLAGSVSELKCRFPARMYYLKLTGLFDQPLDLSECPKLEAFMSVMTSDSVDLTFAGPSVSSPMSYFGHIFLTFRKNNDAYFSRTLTFLAPLDNNESMLSITAAGAFSTIAGQYQIAPYHQIIHQYIEVDQRPIQTYELAIHPDNKRLLLYHVFELAALDRPYNFFWGNCATRIQELLKIAFPVKLGHAPIGITAPQSVIRNLRDQDLIVRGSQIPARSETLFATYQALSSIEREALKALLKAPQKADWVARNGAELLPLAQAIYRRQFRTLGAPPTDYPELMRLPAKPLATPHEVPVPLERSRLLSIGWKNDTAPRTILRFRPGLIDRSRRSLGLATENSFRYLDTALRVRNEGVSIERLDLIALAAIKKRSAIEQSLSWEFTTGWAREFQDDQLDYQVKTAIGMAWGNTQTQFSILPTLAYFAGRDAFPGLAMRARVGLGKAQWSAEILHYGSLSNDRPRNRRRLAVDYELSPAWMVRTGFDQATQGLDVAISHLF